MLKILLLSAVSLVFAGGCGSSESSDTDEARETTDSSGHVTMVNNTVCPVMNSPVASGQHFDWEGYRIGICCPGCEGSFKANPQLYIPLLLEDPGVSEDVKTSISTHLESLETSQ